MKTTPNTKFEDVIKNCKLVSYEQLQVRGISVEKRTHIIDVYDFTWYVIQKRDNTKLYYLAKYERYAAARIEKEIFYDREVEITVFV